jgi:hypothetical protein
MNNVEFKRHQIVFLNGPRKSGKDTAAKFIMQEFALDARQAKMAQPLKLAAAAMFNVNQGEFRKFEAIGSDYKTEPLAKLFNMAWVDLLIWLSEDCMKTRFGGDVFGQLMLSHLTVPSMTKMTVISDSGFADELAPIVQFYGPKNCHLFRIYRQGCTFDGDSRKYILENDIHPDVNIIDIYNNYDLQMFRVQVLRRIDKIMGREMEYN